MPYLASCAGVGTAGHWAKAPRHQAERAGCLELRHCVIWGGFIMHSGRVTPAWHRRAGSPPALVMLLWACSCGQVWVVGTRGDWSPSARRVLLLRTRGEQGQASCAGKAARGGGRSFFVLLSWEPRWLAGRRVPQQAAAPEAGGQGLSLRQGMFQSWTFTGNGTPAMCSALWPGLGGDLPRVWCGAKRHLRGQQLRGQDRGLTGIGGSADC